MKFLIIGSTAMKHWFPEAREPKDVDLLTPASVSGFGVVDGQWHAAAEAIWEASSDKTFADKHVLLTLKVAHAHWNVAHEKTLFDIKFLQDRGAVLNIELYNKLIPVFTERWGKNKVTVNKPMAEFFSDAVERIYDHEWLHEQVAFYDRPIHERLRPDMSNVWCSRELFEELSFEDQLKCALEEIMVTAIERRRLTAQSRQSEILSAMKLSHHKLCTTMATGWFARFNIVNHFDLLFTWRPTWLPHLNSILASLPPRTQTPSSTQSSMPLKPVSHTATPTS